MSITWCKIHVADILNVCWNQKEFDKEQVVIISNGETVKRQDAEDIPYQEPAAHAATAATRKPEETGRYCWE